MPNNKCSIGLTVMLAILTASLLATGTRAAAQQERILHSLNSKIGTQPAASLIFDAAGILYGTAEYGGTHAAGTVFEFTPKPNGVWDAKSLHSFNNNGKDGTDPNGVLVSDAAGNLYGTTHEGGKYNCIDGCGSVFELVRKASGAWTEKVLYSFNDNGTDGTYPDGGLIFDATGNLYGTTAGGGANGHGAVFELTLQPNGKWTDTILHSFNANGTDGYLPEAGLIFDAAGNLYGTTYEGGADFYGTVFALTPAGGGVWNETILHNFGNGTDGSEPEASLVFDAAGNLYGTTYRGGTNGSGTAFELTPAGGGAWNETVLHNFGSGTDGANPTAALIFDSAGNLYGTTSASPYDGGGTQYDGTAFELTPAGGGNWTETVLHDFGVGTDGANPYGALIFDSAGNLYGTTSSGGAYTGGTVFEITP
jgi:uncharacterized repeat protein (TIGR03803 family)